MLIHNWRQVLKRAWSVRLIVLAFMLTTVEVALGFIGSPVWLPTGVFAALSGLVTAGAFVARLYAQKDFPNADQ